MRRHHATVLLAAAACVATACTSTPGGDAQGPSAGWERTTGGAAAGAPTRAELEPIGATGGDTERDLLTADDPSALACLGLLRRAQGEFYDARIDELVFPADTAFLDAMYTDGSTVELRVHPELGDDEDVVARATLVADALGRIPSVLRADVGRVGVVGGDAAAQADGGGEGILLTADNMDVRVGDERLEETLFHEAVHTSLDDRILDDPAWLAAQTADDAFLTAYAANNPTTEDLAETTLYAWAALFHPDRLLAGEAEAFAELVPRRLAFVRDELFAEGPGLAPAGTGIDC